MIDDDGFLAHCVIAALNDNGKCAVTVLAEVCKTSSRTRAYFQIVENGNKYYSQSPFLSIALHVVRIFRLANYSLDYGKV